VATIEERLALLEDEREIVRTMTTYGHAVDYDLADEFRDCWVEDAVWSLPRREPARGYDAIMAVFHGHTHAPALYHKHLMIEPRIEVDGDRATVDSYYVRIDDFEPGPGVMSFGRYRDVLVRCDDGRWRFSERITEGEARRPS
jgi:ketosteroid isomerase-like protein